MMMAVAVRMAVIVVMSVVIVLMVVIVAVLVVEGNPRPLEPGLVFSVEPGVYLPGELGVRLEDQVACGSAGADVLSRRAPRL
jgi:Xaa-Pro aminopeptidase